MIVPPGNTARMTSPGVTSARSAPAHVRDDVMHVRVTLDRHQLVHFDRARHADAAEIVALQVDQHDVLGAFLGMADQFAHARRVVVAGEARPRAGDRPRLRDAVAHVRPGAPARNSTTAQSCHCSNPANGAGFARRRLAYRAAGDGAVRIARAPLARQIDLEHVAGAQVFVDARDAIQKSLRVVFFDMRRRLPAADEGSGAASRSRCSSSSKSA